MNSELIENIKKQMNSIPSINFEGIPANDFEIINAENKLKVKFHKDYITFIKKFGGAYFGIPIYAFNNNEMMTSQTVVDLTESFRKDYENDCRSNILDNSYVISFDGSGNPILIDKKGQVIIIYHDCDEYKILASSFTEFLEKIINNEFENEW